MEKSDESQLTQEEIDAIAHGIADQSCCKRKRQKRNNNNLNTPRLLQAFHKFNLYLGKQRYVHQAGCFFQTQHQIGILNGLPAAAFGKIV